MKIESLDILKLHNSYNYHVEFNPDLTFLYGSNGCGKTTILNIIEAIVSGRLYDLFNWKFYKIKLNYYDDENPEAGKNVILINYSDNNLSINWKGTNKTIKHADLERSCEECDSFDELFVVMRKRYPLLDEVRKEFNYVYLPLNRSTTSVLDNYMYRKLNRYSRYRYMYDETEDRMVSREEHIGKAVKLVQKKHAEAMAQVSAINDEFRNRVLKSLLGTNVEVSNESFINFIYDSTVENEGESVQGQYMKLLDTLGLLDDEEREKYDRFFSAYKRQVKELLTNRTDKKGVSIPVSLVYDYHEIVKMKTVIPIAQEMEEKKAEALRRINQFVDIMNSFIYNSTSDKRLFIDETGRIQFLTNNGEQVSLPTSNLSSGEKQLLIFFANLVFNVDENGSSIFVVDEPELSLHLSWQRMFVEQAMQINNNMQLIFATHAPEIVGKNRDKMYKLEKRIDVS